MELPDESRKSMDDFDKKHGIRHWDKNGMPMSMADWVIAVEDIKYKRIGRYENCMFAVSTVWLGIDHGIGDKPVIFETMVFPRAGKSVLSEVYCQRYTSLEDAKIGHEKAVRIYKRSVYVYLCYYVEFIIKRLQGKINEGVKFICRLRTFNHY